MIRALRRRHFWTMVVIALVLPALFVTILLLRRPLPKPDPAKESRDAPVDAPVAGD